MNFSSGDVSAILGMGSDQVLGQRLSDLLQSGLAGVASVDSLNAVQKLVSDSSNTVNSVEIGSTTPFPKNYLLTVYPPSISQNGPMTGVTIEDVTAAHETEANRDIFLAVLSHELRDPLTAMMGFTGLLLDSAPINSKEQSWLQNVQICGERLTAITKDMLSVAALKGGNLSVQLEEVNLEAIISEVLPLVQRTCSGLRFASSVRQDIPYVVADKAKLAQVLSNLLSNAAKYTSDEGQVNITACYEPHRNRVIVAVVDQGTGIAPQELEHIFAPFYRSVRPEMQRVSGVGLGLYVVENLVKMMGGAVSVESELGRGSTFYVSLPTKEEQSVLGRG
ncbi:MAG: HAMP domain-containing sensor histidine kinase [Chloroflexi bacterium]|nr:HAMP domain-containing sensor histidine kinase [Chloroflexota bacterium]MDA1220002.1 HAMP domain-containing sensor histidine kinase [Chloroflexota bacterium]